MADDTCRWPGCERPHHSKGFCPRDYQRAKREGDYSAPWLTWAPVYVKPPHCRWPDCGTVTIEGRGLCKMHWLRAYRLDDFDSPWEAWTANTCEGCGVEFVGRNRRVRYCSEPCNTEAWKRQNVERVRRLERERVSRRRALILGTSVEKFGEADVRERHGDDCYLCERTIDYALPWPDPASPSMDHIVPLSLGGTHTLDNVAMTHLRCNNKKNARTTDKRPRTRAPAEQAPACGANPIRR
jgi:5-methylcytosine-specific restriction endonuclease McrA